MNRIRVIYRKQFIINDFSDVQKFRLPNFELTFFSWNLKSLELSQKLAWLERFTKIVCMFSSIRNMLRRHFKRTGGIIA